MKKVAALFLLMLVAMLGATAQKVSYTAVKNQDLTYVLNNIEKTTSYTNNTNLYVHVYKVADPSGSAHS